MTSLIGFLITLSVLIVIHELGHYLVARACGVRVLAFSFGFGPVLARRRDRRGCEWRLSAVPLGGYVKMLTAGAGAGAAGGGGEPGEGADPSRAFDRQGVGKRFAIVAAGPLMNFALAAAIYAGIAMTGTYEPSARLGTPPPATQAALAGVERGWRVIEIGDGKVTTFNDVRFKLLEHAGESDVAVRLDAGGSAEKSVSFSLAEPGAGGGADPARELGLTVYAERTVIAGVVPGSPAEKAGLAAGEAVLACDGREVSEPQDVIRATLASAGRPVRLTLEGPAGRREVSVTPAVDKDGKARIGARLAVKPEIVEVRQGPLAALASGWARVWDFAAINVKGFAQLASGRADVGTLSGPVAIGAMAGESLRAGWLQFLFFLAAVSVGLGVINLFPVPVLDGGHLMFYLYEIAMRRKPSPRAALIGQRIGLAFVLGLSLFALGNDFVKIFGLKFGF
ncbi:MAG: RIP metalloprotease RseP [Duodenibacillus sp.]|nr:RIP metalloprotease RseP [Duodenibacillus sp.]